MAGPSILRQPATRVLTATLLVTAAIGCDGAPESPEPALGIARELARERVGQVADLRYRLRLHVPAERARPLTGRMELDFDWRGGDGALVLDFKNPTERVAAVRVDGEDVAWRAVEDHIVLEVAALAPGRRSVVVDFEAGDDALNRSEDFLYTLFVPDRAHFSLPVLDQPDLKARFTLHLSVPEGWVAVGNGADVGVPEVLGDTARLYTFAETEPISTYLFAFAAGRFEIEEAERDGRWLRMFHRETDAEKVHANRDAVFDLTAASIAFMEEYTGIDYPFGKFDFVLLPPFQYGGMEHPGAVFYRQSSLLLEPTATQGAILGRASLIAHETAHMWFGDLVTMEWFDDVWTKEVFANFMAAKMVHPSFPDLDHDLRFLLSHHPSAYAVDRTPGANAIRQPLDNLREAGTLYGPIIYQKAPIVMRKLERTLGEDAFRAGLREYLERHAFGNATWPTLIEILDDRTDRPLAPWSAVWVEEPGRPTLEVDAAPGTEAGSVRLTVRQADPFGRGRLWPQTLELVLPDGAGGLRRVDVALDGATAEVSVDGVSEVPAWVLPNAAGLEYGLFRIGPDASRALLEALAGLDPALLRGAGWLVTQDAMLEGDLPPETVLEHALEALPLEDEEQLAQLLLGLIGRVYWGFLPDEARARWAEPIEAALWSGVTGAPTSTLRAAYLGAYRSMATRDEALGRLRGLWSGALVVDGLPLGESDRTALAEALAIRGVADADTILAREQERIVNPDRRARFEFLRPALSADPAVREAFFASLADPANRAREPWVLDGLEAIGHPLRREHALRFVRPGLDLLEEIQRTGDIFFPGRWLDALLGAHTHPEAVRAIDGYLRGRPDLAPRLRAKVLQSADGVWRAARLVHGATDLPPLEPMPPTNEPGYGLAGTR